MNFGIKSGKLSSWLIFSNKRCRCLFNFRIFGSLLNRAADVFRMNKWNENKLFLQVASCIYYNSFTTNMQAALILDTELIKSQKSFVYLDLIHKGKNIIEFLQRTNKFNISLKISVIVTLDPLMDNILKWSHFKNLSINAPRFLKCFLSFLDIIN